VTSHGTEQIATQTCPQCGEPLLTSPNFAAWCSACEWNLGQPAEERKGIFRSRIDKWSARQVENLFRQVSGSRVKRPGWGLARVVSYTIAGCVDLLCPALLAVGAWLLVTMPNVVTVMLAILAFLLGLELRPRLGSWRKQRDVKYRKDAPELFGLLDQIAAGVGAKRVHGLIVNASWNASYQAVGWRRRRVVTLGLPLWDALSPDQRVAVLGHEFAHGVNGDARHGAIVGASLGTLVRLQSMLRPGRRTLGGTRRATVSEMVALSEMVARIMQALLCSIVGGVLNVQYLVSRRASQRAEYLADALAARVASPTSTADMLDILLTGDGTYSFVVERRRFTNRDTDFWTQLRSALADIPEGEKERRRRRGARERLRLTDTHPPVHLRVKVLRGLPAGEPLVSVSAAQADKIRAELEPDYARVARVIDDAARLAR
jgi:Zn-dependent protease with chaperone function